MLNVYALMHCPRLIFIATSPLRGSAPPWVEEAIAAYRRGLTRDLASLADRTATCASFRLTRVTP